MDQENINRVESYIKGELSPDEKRQFDQEIANNSELAAIYREYTLAMDAIDHQVESELREQFSNWEKRGDTKQQSVKFLPILWKVAASFIFIAAVYSVFIQNSNEFESRQQIALNAYELPASPGRTMGESSELWDEGLIAYEASDFATAADKWSTIENPNVEIQFYLAHANFNIPKYDESIKLFTSLSKSTSGYKQSSEWQLLLSYLAAEEIRLSDDLVRKITDDPKHPFFQKVRDLEKNLKKLKKEK